MLRPDDHARFLELSAKGVPPADFVARFELLYGWKPPSEILEYETARLAYAAHLEAISDRWMFIEPDPDDDDLAFPDEMAAHPELMEDEELAIHYLPPSARWVVRGENAEETLDRLLSSYSGTMFLFTGLVHLGSDPSGDSCWISLLPHPKNAAEVYPYDHEVGKLQGDVHYSLAHFVVSQWDSEEETGDYFEEDEDEDEADEDSDEETDEDENNDEQGDDDDGTDEEEQTRKRFVDPALVVQFETEAKKLHRDRPPFSMPLALFRRAHWLLGHVYDNPTYAFAEHMGRAATFSDWEKEKGKLVSYPHLIPYWMIAHYFLQNDDACREACLLAEKLPGEIAQVLARRILRQLDSPEPIAFKSIPSAARLQKLREMTLKNASEGLLEKQTRERVAAMNTANGEARLSRAECEKRLAAGEDPFALLAEFPDDVDTHDRCLAKAGEGDARFAKLVKEYLRERSDSYYNTWPYDEEDLDRRFSLPCAAAFRAGLRYDADHKKAFCGITKTLGMLDDDAAMKAFAEAIERLEQDDDRFESIIQSLNQSKHRGAPGLIRVAARKFLGSMADAIEKQKRIDAKGFTLDAMFMENSKLRPALSAALHFEDDVAEELTDRILASRENLKIYGMALGDAFRVVRRRGLDRHVDFAETYLQTVAKAAPEAESFEFRILYNCSEAAMTLGACIPDRALTFLRESFDAAQANPNRGSRIDLIACLLPGLLMLQPDEPLWQEWLQRILGNRSGEYRVYGPLAALSESGKTKLEPDPDILASIKHHVYADPRPMVDYTSVYIERSARRAWVVLTGESLPPFDDEDEYANGQEGEAIAAAIAHPERFSTEHVFQRVREEGLRHEDVVRLGGPWLLDSLRFSGDEVRYSQNSDRWNCLKAMILQGEQALPTLAACLDLPHIKRNWLVALFATMRFCSSEAKARVVYARLNKDELFARLMKPEMADLPFLDVLASSAFALAEDEAIEPAMAALRHRMQYLDDQYPHYSEMDLMLAALPRVIVATGDAGRRAIDALWSETKDNEEADKVLGEALQMPEIKTQAMDAPAPAATVELVAPSPSPDEDVRRVFRLQRRGSVSLLECETSNYDAMGLLIDDRIASEATYEDANLQARLIRAAEREGFAAAKKKGKKKA